MICFPNAKINLGLSVVGKRSDGLHNLNTCFIPIPLYDILEIKESEEFSLSVIGDFCCVDDNIIVKAWKLIEMYCPRKVEVLLYKNIPVGSGLGGGSSDAMFFILNVIKLFNIEISESKVKEMAVCLGADCSFFIENTASLATGIGDQLEKINSPIAGDYISVIYPDIEISTRSFFQKITLYSEINYHSIFGNSKASWKNNLVNSFQEILFVMYPETKTIVEKLSRYGAYYVSVTGTGSAIYALSDNPLKINDIDAWSWCGRLK